MFICEKRKSSLHVKEIKPANEITKVLGKTILLKLFLEICMRNVQLMTNDLQLNIC